MEKDDRIAPISKEALAAFREEKSAITQEVAARSLSREDEVAHHGEEAGRLVTSGIEFTTRMLEAAMTVGEITLLDDQLTWAMERLPHDGVSPQYVLNRFRIYRQVVEDVLPKPHASEITPFLDWMIARQRELIGQEGNAA
jgi:hypothetical protein